MKTGEDKMSVEQNPVVDPLFTDVESARNAINCFWSEIEGAAKRHGISAYVVAAAVDTRMEGREGRLTGGWCEGDPMTGMYMAGHVKGMAQTMMLNSAQRRVAQGEKDGGR